MTILTETQVRENVQTAMVDAAFQRLIDTATAAIVDWQGEVSPAARIRVVGPTQAVTLNPPAAAITEVRLDGVVIPADSYILSPGGRVVTPYAARFWKNAEITYTVPDIVLRRREQVLIDLVRYAVRNTGVQMERVGTEYEATYWGSDEWYRILAQLDAGVSIG